MQQRTKSEASNDVRIPRVSSNSLLGTMFYWYLMAGMLLPFTSGTYKDDPCETKSQPGLCKGWSECTTIKALIERGEYTKREVVSCGFGIREELICCPVVKTESKIEVKPPTTTESTDAAQERDFWLDVLDELKANSTTTITSTTTTTTTQKPDFWLDLLSSTTTTTVKPLIIGNMSLDKSSEYFDFAELLSGKSANQRREAPRTGVATNAQSHNGEANNNGNSDNRSTNLNTGPININKWNFGDHQNFGPNNNGRSPNGHGLQNIGRGGYFQNTNQNFLHNGNGRGGPNVNSNFQNSGGGPGVPNINSNFHNNGRGGGRGGPNMHANFESNGRNFGGVRGGPNDYFQNNGNGRGGPGINNNFYNSGGGRGGPNINSNFQNNGRGNMGNGQNMHQFQAPANNQGGRGFSFPTDNFQNSSPDQNWAASSLSTQRVAAPSKNNSEHLAADELINEVFKTPQNSNISSNSGLTNMDEVIWSIFNEQPSHPTLENSNPTVLWLNNPGATFVNVEYTDTAHAQPFEQMVMPSGHIFEDPNDLEMAASNHPFVAVQPFEPTPGNLVNIGMEIVKAKADIVEQALQQHQQQHQQPQFGQQEQFGQQPNYQPQYESQPHFGQQPQQFAAQQTNRQQQIGQQSFHQQQFGYKQTQFGYQPNRPQETQFEIQRPDSVHQFGQPSGIQQQPAQNNVEHPQNQQYQELTHTATEPKQPRTPNPFVQTPPSGPQLPNVQSPPANILDPFKPFEFRPPPDDEVVFEDGDNSIRPVSTPVTTGATTGRPAVRACQRILKGLFLGLTTHILGGTPAELGEFPHMVAIGYSRLGDDGQGPYDIRCGGTLIDDRFVLTAAHCVAARDNVPAIARMGVVNFTDPNAMQDAVEIKIKNVIIHDDYSQRRTYNDIAILELERPAPLSEFIQPVCLYTDEADPDPSIKLWVTGWGTVNTSTRAYSDILLKAPLHVTPLSRCNDSFVQYGLTRQINEGIVKTQLCAEDMDQIRDACQGDSGGPLNLVVDEAYKNYRLVGVVSSGFGCASSTPGLYTRVAAFLDFIERVVWPNGGD